MIRQLRARDRAPRYAAATVVLAGVLLSCGTAAAQSSTWPGYLPPPETARFSRIEDGNVPLPSRRVHRLAVAGFALAGTGTLFNTAAVATTFTTDEPVPIALGVTGGLSWLIDTPLLLKAERLSRGGRSSSLAAACWGLYVLSIVMTIVNTVHGFLTYGEGIEWKAPSHAAVTMAARTISLILGARALRQAPY